MIASPVPHQLPAASAPETNRATHQEGCDLVNIGATKTPDTSNTHPLNPMTTLTHVQEDQAVEALIDQEIETAHGGIGIVPVLIGTMAVADTAVTGAMVYWGWKIWRG